MSVESGVRVTGHEIPGGSTSAVLKEALDAGYGEDAGFVAEVEAFLQQFDPVPAGTPMEEYRQRTRTFIEAMCAEGFSAPAFPVEYGGGDSRKKFLYFNEKLAMLDMSYFVKQGVQFGLFGLAVNALGTKKHHDLHLQNIIKGRTLGGFAMTEMRGGSDVQGCETEAVYDPVTHGFTINTPNDGAVKAYIGNAARDGEMMVVFAQLKMAPGEESKGVHALLVPIRDRSGNPREGVQIADHGEKVGLNGVDNGTIRFNDFKVSGIALLDRFAQIDEQGKYHSDIENPAARFFKMISTLVTGRAAVALTSLTLSKMALTKAVRYAHEREVFGTRMMLKQATQKRIIPHLASVYAMHFSTREMINMADKGPSRELETLAAALKVRSSEMAMEIVDEMRLVHGGAGFMADERFGAWRNDIDILRTFEGDNTVLRLLVAKNGLDSLRNQFNGVSGIEKRRRMAVLKLKDLSAQFSLKKFNVLHEKLLHPEYQLALVEQREASMLLALANKLKKEAKESGGFSAAADLCQNDMIAYANAQTDTIMLRAMIKAEQGQDDQTAKFNLACVREMFGARTILSNAAWYLENGHMTSRQTKSLAQTEASLLRILILRAPMLTEAFAIPEKFLTAPDVRNDAEKRSELEFEPA